MISSMLLFFRRDCEDGGGPAVELASPPVFDASLVVPPKAGTGWLGADVAEGCVAAVAGFAAPKPNPLGALLVAVVAPDAAGAELPAPSPLNSDEPEAAAVVAPAEAVVVVAPLAGGVLPVVGVAGLPMFENRLDAGAAGFAASVFPPILKPPRLGGCEDAGAAGVVPRLKDGGLLPGVDDAV
jgi:hypothetical protein